MPGRHPPDSESRHPYLPFSAIKSHLYPTLRLCQIFISILLTNSENLFLYKRRSMERYLYRNKCSEIVCVIMVCKFSEIVCVCLCLCVNLHRLITPSLLSFRNLNLHNTSENSQAEQTHTAEHTHTAEQTQRKMLIF